MLHICSEKSDRSSGKVTVRQATADDYQGVLDLDPNNTIYSGNDYLPAEYFRILNDPDREITVYLLDGTIVSNIVDNMYGTYTLFLAKHRNVVVTLLKSDVIYTLYPLNTRIINDTYQSLV